MPPPKKKKKKNYAKMLRGGQEVPMDIDKINASFEATQKTEPEPRKKKKKKYLNILTIPVEKLTGWQEVTDVNIEDVNARMEAARLRPLDQYFTRHKE